MYAVKQHNPITMILSNIIDWFVVCDPEIECLVWELWDFMHGVHPEDQWRKQLLRMFGPELIRIN